MKKDNEYLAKMLADNKDVPFVKRIMAAKGERGSIDNGDGSHSTHSMAAEVDGNGRWMVFPTVANYGDGMKRYELREAQGRAVDSGNVIYMKDKHSALWFSKNYKKAWEDGFGEAPSQLADKFGRLGKGWRNKEYTPPSVKEYDFEIGLGYSEIMEKLGEQPKNRGDGSVGYPLNKFKMLAEVYGSPEEVYKQMVEAGQNSHDNNLNLSFLPKPGDEVVSVYRNDKAAQAGTEKVGGKREPFINTRVSTQSEQKKVRGWVGIGEGLLGEAMDNKGTLFHELTHVLEGRDEQHIKINDYWKTRPGDGRSVVKSDENQKSMAYGEYASAEIFPPLTAITHEHFKTEGKRITTGKEYDKLVADYGAMTRKEKNDFVKKMSPEAARFYGYIDYLEEEDKPIKIKNAYGDVETIEGGERLKRWHEINRKYIPSVVSVEPSSQLYEQRASIV